MQCRRRRFGACCSWSSRSSRSSRVTRPARHRCGRRGRAGRWRGRVRAVRVGLRRRRRRDARRHRRAGAGGVRQRRLARHHARRRVPHVAPAGSVTDREPASASAGARGPPDRRSARGDGAAGQRARGQRHPADVGGHGDRRGPAGTAARCARPTDRVRRARVRPPAGRPQPRGQAARDPHPRRAGAFTLRRAVEDVSDSMGVSRITVYNYLNAIHR